MPNDFENLGEDLRFLVDIHNINDSIDDFIDIRSGRIIRPVISNSVEFSNKNGELVTDRNEDSLTPYPDRPIDVIEPFSKMDKKMTTILPPFKVYDETIENDTPIILGDYCMWKAKSTLTVFVCRRVPEITLFRLTVKKEVIGDTIKIIGGSISYRANVAISHTDIINNESYWRNELEKIESVYNSYDFRELEIVNEYHKLVLPNDKDEDFARDHLLVIGLGYIEKELSEKDVLMWMEALENHQGSKITGIHKFQIKFGKGKVTIFINGDPLDIPNLKDKVQYGYFESSMPISTLSLDKFGAESITIINPKIEEETKILVSNNSIVEHVIITLVTNDGKIISYTATSEGGVFSNKWTTDEMSSLEIEWEAIIKYHPTQWPEIKVSGKLSAIDNNLIATIKPESWIREHSIIIILMDEQGNILPAEIAKIYNVYAEFIFKASFLEGDGLLQYAFQMESQKTLKVQFPKPPGKVEANLQLRLSVFGNQNKKLEIFILKEDDNFIIAKIFLDKRIQIETNK
jgi:hypothetical protein